MKYKWLIGILLIAVSVGGFWYYQKDKNTTEETYTTSKVVKTDLRISFGVDGQLEMKTYEPNFLISGKVAWVGVKEGDVVKKGQLLATLDVTEAQKNLEKTLKDYSIQRNSFEEMTNVTYVDDVVTETLKRVLQNNQWNLDKSVLDVEIKNLAIRESKLYSPADGVVAILNISAGESVSTQNQNPVITIADTSGLSFVGYAEEDQVLQINGEQSIYIELESYDKEKFPATLSFLSPLAEVDSNGINSYKIVSQITNPDDLKLYDGMAGMVNFVTKEVKGVVAVSNKAVYLEDGVSYVDVLEGGSFVKTKITTGFTDGKSVEVVNGLTVGQEVKLKK